MIDSTKEIAVIGAGLVGAIQALLLARAGNRVTVIERRSLLSSNSTSDPLSTRTVALSHRTWQLLTAAGLWPSIDHCPIQTIHVNEQGKFGSVRMCAQDVGVEALGFVLSNSEFESYLHSLLKSESGIRVIENAKVVSVKHNVPSGIDLVVAAQDTQQEFSTEVLIAADGSDSATRTLLGIDAEQSDYKQCAVIANVATTKKHGFTAYERFTKTGPLALLPLASRDDSGNGNGHIYSMIFTASDKDTTMLQSISGQDFLTHVQEKFGGKLGRFEAIGPRIIAPLKLIVSAKQVEKRAVLIGNASRTLHPVAGQGLNLAMRDVFELTACFGVHDDADEALREFVDNRRQDQAIVTRQTDMLARAFLDKPWPLRLPLSAVSSASFFLLDCIDPLRKQFAKASMGHNVDLPS